MQVGAELVEAMVGTWLLAGGPVAGRGGRGHDMPLLEAVEALFQTGHLASDEDFADPLDLAGGIER
jgi:hypothetical protein